MHGVLSVARIRGRPAFTPDDLEMAAGFANQAAVAIELAAARVEQQRAAMLDERERIAADLHDHVIQRLFATGLSLQALASTLGPGRAGQRVLTAIADLDATIAQIRTSIFELQQNPRPPPRCLRARLLDVVTEVTPALGFDPGVRFSGLLDLLPDQTAQDLLAVLREALTNIARHAHAPTADVDLTAHPEWLTLDIRDDGTGLGATTRRSGLTNLRHRAQRHGGTLILTPATPPAPGCPGRSRTTDTSPDPNRQSGQREPPAPVGDPVRTVPPAGTFGSATTRLIRRIVDRVTLRNTRGRSAAAADSGSSTAASACACSAKAPSGGWCTRPGTPADRPFARWRAAGGRAADRGVRRADHRPAGAVGLAGLALTVLITIDDWRRSDLAIDPTVARGGDAEARMGWASALGAQRCIG